MTQSDRAGFLAAILEHPGDDTHRGAYADALRESDHAFDRLHGEFIWAGLELARVRADPEEDAAFVPASNALAETTVPVLGVQLKHLMNWHQGGWGWSNDFDRITAARLPDAESTRVRNLPGRGLATEAVVWERGCVHTLRLPLERWLRAGAGFFAACPVQCVVVTDVRGLTFRVLDSAATGWRLTASLDLPRVRGTFGNADHPVLDQPAANLFRVRPTVEANPLGLTRRQLLDNLYHGSAALVEQLRDLAGVRWPGGVLAADAVSLLIAQIDRGEADSDDVVLEQT